MEQHAIVALLGKSALFGSLAVALAALAYAGNTLRSIRDRYRESYREELGRWQALRDELDRIERSARSARTATSSIPLRSCGLLIEKKTSSSS